nr:MAG TPA: hypothetical protein [Caudoviricetes sp.]DAT55954.1 MAG TPA: hypothetical protein [Caudoviricetes sp.]
MAFSTHLRDFFCQNRCFYVALYLFSCVNKHTFDPLLTLF